MQTIFRDRNQQPTRIEIIKSITSGADPRQRYSIKVLHYGNEARLNACLNAFSLVLY